MSESIGQKDIHGDFIHVGDLVHCWDGDVDQREVAQSLRGMVNEVGGAYSVGDNGLALGCAEHVEIIDKLEQGVNK